MITREETEKLLERFRDSRPKILTQHFDREDAGIVHVMNILAGAGEPVTAGKISKCMNVSTARVAVLLKKMEQQNLIVRSADSSDARKTMIDLSEHGRSEMEKAKENFYRFCSAVIERTGVERFTEFIEISEELKNAIEAEMESCSKCRNEEERG